MPYFSANVSLHNSRGQLVQFVPGDKVPDWAKERVGDHVLRKAKPKDEEQASTAEEEAAEEEPQTSEEEEVGDEQPAEEANAEPEAQAEEETADAEKPDFTKPTRKPAKNKK